MVSERSATAAFIMSYVVIVFSAISLISLYAGHLYYRRKVAREIYLREQRTIVQEIRKPKRYASFLSINGRDPLPTADEVLRAPTPPPNVERWNSLLHLFWSFRI